MKRYCKTFSYAWIILVVLLCASRIRGETLPLTGASAYDPEPEVDTFGLAWAFSTGTIEPTVGRINHNACAIANYFGLERIGVLDAIRSADFTVSHSGRYKLHISGFINGAIREGSSASFPGGVSKSGGKLWIGGGFTSVGLEEQVLHETDFSNWAMVTEMAWATWTVFLDKIDETGVASELLLSIKDYIQPQVTWDGNSFNLDSYTYLEEGVPYKWAFYVASSVGAGAIGIDVREVALYEAYIYGLSADLTYLDSEILDPPTGVTASDGDYTDKVRVIWNTVSDAEGYDIYRNTASNSDTATKVGTNVGKMNNLYDDTSALPGTYYYYWVRSKKYSPVLVSELSNPNSGYAAPTPSDITLTPSDDAMLLSSSPDATGGNITSIWIWTGTGAGRSVGAIKFNLSSIPIGSVVDSAELRLYCDRDDGGTVEIGEFYNSDWSEDTITWNNHPPVRTITGDEDLGSIGWWIWNSSTFPILKSKVQEWVNNPDENYGLALLTPQDSTSSIRFNSKESPNSNERPKLMVNYTPPPSPNMSYYSHQIDDDTSGGSNGNGDGVVDPGEMIELIITLKNTGSGDAHNVSAHLSTTDSYVTISDSDENYGDISSGGTGECSADYDFTVSPSCPDDHVITFNLNPIQSNEGTWSDSFQITVHSGGGDEPEMTVYGHGGAGVKIDDGDTTPSADENTYFGSIDVQGGISDAHFFRIRNSGTASTDLYLTGDPTVEITGPHASDFTVSSKPESPIEPGGYTTFRIYFEPSAEGTRTATVLIANNDSDKNPYDFAIEGDGFVSGGTHFSDSGITLPGADYGGGNGIALGDYDNDGDLDLALGTRIFRNDGNGNLTDIQAGLPELYWHSVAWGDYDNDGDLDIAICGGSGGSEITKIYRNDGNDTFTDIGADLVGVDAGCVAWADYDNDGDLDLALSGYGGALITKLYKNIRGDVFVDIGAELIALFNSYLAWGDYDNDGDADLAVSGYSGSGPLIAATRLYRNNGNDVFALVGADFTDVGNGSIAWGDYDNDGDLDLAVTGYMPHPQNGPFADIYRNDGDGNFTPIGAGLSPVGSYGSLAWGDYDNDGHLDLALCGSTYPDPGNFTQVYKNKGNDNFNLVEDQLTGLGGTIVWGDYDNDGDLDLFVSGEGESGSLTKIYDNREADPLGNDNPNTLPSPPVSLICEAESDKLMLKWAPGSDSETPVKGLYYSVRVGTSPGANDVVSSTYASPLLGNYLRPKLSGEQLGIALKDLPDGGYYWSVKTIDTALGASVWAPGTAGIVGDFCGADFGPPDGYVDVWDLMQFGNHWHTSSSDTNNWDSKFDLTGPNFGPPDGYIDVWDLMVFADHWHEGVKP